MFSEKRATLSFPVILRIAYSSDLPKMTTLTIRQDALYYSNLQLISTVITFQPIRPSSIQVSKHTNEQLQIWLFSHSEQYPPLNSIQRPSFIHILLHRIVCLPIWTDNQLCGFLLHSLLTRSSFPCLHFIIQLHVHEPFIAHTLQFHSLQIIIRLPQSHIHLHQR